MTSEKNNPASIAAERIRVAFETLSSLEPDERLRVYSELRETNSMSIGNSTEVVFNDAVKASDLVVLPSGSVGLRKPRVFLSHSSVDKDAVRVVADALFNEGIRFWLDEAELRIGDSLIQKLGDALDHVDLVLAFISPTSIQSEWVRRELEIAINNEIHCKRVVVLPVVLGVVQMPPFLRGKLYADFSDASKTQKNMPQLIRSIYAHFGRDEA